MTHRTLWLGAALTVLVSILFAINSTLARVTYDAGSNALTLNTVRIGAAAVALYVVLRLIGVPVRLPSRERMIAFAFGVMLGAYSFFLYRAIEEMPVALCIITFYLYPLLTGIASAALGVERMTAVTAVALVTALAGLTVALDIWDKAPSLLGVALAAASAVTFTAVIVLNGRLIRGFDSRPVTLHMLTAGSLSTALVTFATGSFALPVGSEGQIAFALVVVLYVIAIIGFFIGLAMIGPVKTALFMHFEPVASLILGVIILDQVLAPVQWIGAAVVIAAMVGARVEAMRR